ncbi:MAG: OmpA family protein, partial [Alphaproteobacteria bacterium]|nr:OmpA family protein [Alphaproteobacteria bacterium]
GTPPGAMAQVSPVAGLPSAPLGQPAAPLARPPASAAPGVSASYALPGLVVPPDQAIFLQVYLQHLAAQQATIVNGQTPPTFAAAAPAPTGPLPSRVAAYAGAFVPPPVNGGTAAVLPFGLGAAMPDAEGMALLRELAGQAAAAGAGLRVVGHASRSGAGDLELSIRRAESVAKVLQQAGMPAERLVVEGRGSSQPVAALQAAEAEAQSRRVEVYWQ